MFTAEPIEVAVIFLRARWAADRDRAVHRADAAPPHAPVTPFDVDQTGITPQMIADMPPAAEAIAKLDTLLATPTLALLVAHQAPVEAGVLGWACQRPALAGLHHAR
jgi:DNA polymerase III subunit epsilon